MLMLMLKVPPAGGDGMELHHKSFTNINYGGWKNESLGPGVICFRGGTQYKLIGIIFLHRTRIDAFPRGIFNFIQLCVVRWAKVSVCFNRYAFDSHSKCFSFIHSIEIISRFIGIPCRISADLHQCASNTPLSILTRKA